MPAAEIACFSYLSGVQTLHVASYPPADYGTEVHRVERFLAADGPIAAGAAATLGRRVMLVSNSLADDDIGQYVRRQLTDWGVDPPRISADRNVTPLSTVVAAANGTRTWFPYLPGVATELGTVDLALLTSARFAYIDCYEVLASVAERAVVTALDSGLDVLANLGGSPPPEWLSKRRLGRAVRILQTNVADERAGSATSVADELGGLDVADAVVVTKGRHGASVRTRNSAFDASCPPITPNRVQGAGSIFSAALIDRLLAGADVFSAVGYACVAGTSWCCGESGPPSADEIRMLAYRHNYPVLA